jgi:hypothetical protein
MKKGSSDGDSIDVKLGGRSRDQVRSLDFKVPLVDEKKPYPLDDPGSQPEVGLLGGKSLLLPVEGVAII